MAGSQGSYASQSGSALESIVISVLERKGFKTVSYNKWCKDPAKYGDELLIKSVPYTTIYNHHGKTEFLLLSKKYNFTIRIECKWQQVAGSVDEKFPYLYINCLECIPENEIIIIVDGMGAKEGSVLWLKNACRNKLYTNETSKNKNIHVLTAAEFIAWTNSAFR